MKVTTLFTATAWLMGLQATAQAAQTIHCKSWDMFKQNVTVDVQLDGDHTMVAVDLDGQKETGTAKVETWKSGPNRCGSVANGVYLDVNLPKVHAMNLVLSYFGTGCTSPSSITYDGTQYAEVYLTCDGLPY